MRRALLVITGVLVAGSVLGATVFREDIARAAGSAPVTVTNTAAQAVPVHEINSAPAQVPAFFRGDASDLSDPVVPAVPAGKRFIMTYINISTVTGGEGTACVLFVGPPGGTFTNWGTFFLQGSGEPGGTAAATEQVFIPIEAEQAATVSTGCPSSALVRIGGYFVSAG